MSPREAVRKAIRGVDREVARLAAHVSESNASALDGFRRSWGRLVDLLSLGPAPGNPERSQQDGREARPPGKS